MIFELSTKYSINSLCKIMDINRSGYYKWLNRRSNPSIREINRISACNLFKEYNKKYPSHGYRWLNAKIKLDIGVVYSDNYAHKICKYLGIKSISKHFKRYGKKVNRELKNFPNYILAELNPLRPFQIVVTDMTAFWANKHYYELTLYMDLFNNQIIAYYLSSKKGNPSSYHICSGICVPSNAPSPIVVSFLGIFTVTKPPQFLAKPLLIIPMPSGSLILCNCSHPSKALSPITLTPSGITIDSI